MPVRCWKTKDGWACRWGESGKVYRSKDKEAARKKAAKQGRAIKAKEK
jgi:hypothetical protein